MASLSVVIPAFNDAELLRHCLDALAAQSHPADEILVVDNGSTDATAAVAVAGGARVIAQPIRGIWQAAATGYDAARGEIIARLDADSRPPVDWLARIEAELGADDTVDAITGPGEFYDGNPVISALGEVIYIGGYFWSVSLWTGAPPLFGSNFAMRRELWWRTRDRVHRGRRNVHDDMDFSFHLDPGDRVVYDKTLRVGISGRPLGTVRGFVRRMAVALHTFAIHLPQLPPWRMRAARRAYHRSAAESAR